MQTRIEAAIKNNKIVLFSYFRSTSSWRIRTILNIKKIEHHIFALNLLENEQNNPEFCKINPNGSVPTLFIEGHFLPESMSVAEFLEEKFPENVALLPKDLFLRAKVRQICESVNAGIQPLQNLKVLKFVELEFKGDRVAWAHKWNKDGLNVIEAILKESSGKHCVGDQITLADCFVVPHYKNAVARIGINPVDFPFCQKVLEAIKGNEAFEKAFPENQVDAK